MPGRRTSAAHDWPIAGGECGRLIRERDWSDTPVGPMDCWSPELRATVANIVNSPVAQVLMWGPDHIMFYNDAYSQVAAAKHPAALGGTVPGIWPEIWDWNEAILTRGLAGEIVSFHDQPLTLERGGVSETLIFDLFYTPVYEVDGSVGGVMCTCIDNSARSAAERRVAESEMELRRITDALPVLVSFLDREHVYRFANRAYVEWFGADPVGRHVREVVGEATYADRVSAIDRAFAGEAFSAQISLPHRDGTLRDVETRCIPRFEADGTVSGVHLLGFDLEDRARREAALALGNSRFRTAMDAVDGVLWTTDPRGRMIGEQPGWAALTGQAAEAYAGYGWQDAIHPDDREATAAGLRQARRTSSMFIDEHRLRRHCGGWRTFAVRAVPIVGDDGRIGEWVGVHTDITHRRAAEQALREQAETLAAQGRHRERAEAQLRLLNESLEARVMAEMDERRQAEAKLVQAQKMETIGKLTGGVAHDFNNLLQVVSGNLQLLARDVAGSEKAERRLANAMAGVSRGSKLAAQLLAFGRRQALEPKVVNLSRFVRGTDDMLRRAIGEGIEIETIVGGGLWNSFVDPGQVENALLNLAINARDAMDGQGKLTIELGNASLDEAYARTHDECEPGQYVMLAVSDTGCGMNPAILERVFEPFFSTKSEGKGSGLGLSMVYGFVKQSGGHVKLYSEPGEGTTIKLYLPRAVEAEETEVAVAAVPVEGGSETVLVVEDDAEVRATVVEMLTDLGYRVLKAVDAQSALAVVESGVPIDLLFTDVVMPGTLKSPELARRAKARLPRLAVLFTSGYTQNAIVHGGKLDPGVELLSKPYTREALARRFRHLLAGRAPAEGRDAPGATALLVEDDALIRMSAAEMLQAAGCVVVEAASGEEALAALQTAPIDVLVTDVNLPGESGVALAERARGLRPSVGIVFATGDAAAAESGVIEGAVTLAKPYDGDGLVAAVRRALGERGTRAGGGRRERAAG